MARSTSRLPLIIAAVLGLVMILGVRLLVNGSSDDPSAQEPPTDGESSVAAPTDCATVTIAASSEKAALLTGMAGQYNAGNRQVSGECVWMEVVTKASGAAATALARGWDESVDGPRPDVWSPASSSWAVLADHDAAAADHPSPIPKERPSLVQTPLVIAMPQPMAETLGWPDEPIGWSDLATLARSNGWAQEGHPEWGRFKLGKTNPHFSTSGLNATVASYFAATGVSSDLTETQVEDPKTRKFVSAIEDAVVHYGDTTLTFLENMTREQAGGQGLTYVSAVTVEEKSVLDYNLGNPSGDPKTLGQGAKPSVPLAAVYPKEGTLLSDNPWLVLDADWVTPVQAQAAGEFLAWLREPAQQERFTSAGFRTFDGKPGEVIKPANGMLPEGPRTILSPPSPAVLAAIQDSWDDLRKRAHVQFIMDVSGSMGEVVTSAGLTKLKLAQDAAIEGIDAFAADDEVGLTSFSTNLGANGEPWLTLEPIRPAEQAVPAMQKDIAAMVADGGTALYATLRQAQSAMLKELSTDRISAIIMLTDGKNEYPPDDDLNSLLEQLQGESTDTTVRIFTIGYGEGADPATLQAIADASRGAYYEATDPASIERVLVSVISNF